MQAKVKTKGASQPFAISANRLRDGRVVWLAEGGRWSEALADAAIFRGAAADEGMRVAALAEAEQSVVGAYLVELTPEAAGPAPLRAREKFRAGGPTFPLPAAA